MNFNGIVMNYPNWSAGRSKVVKSHSTTLITFAELLQKAMERERERDQSIPFWSVIRTRDLLPTQSWRFYVLIGVDNNMWTCWEIRSKHNIVQEPMEVVAMKFSRNMWTRKQPTQSNIGIYRAVLVTSEIRVEHIISYWVNYNDLNKQPHHKWWLIREIIPFYGLNSG